MVSDRRRYFALGMGVGLSIGAFAIARGSTNLPDWANGACYDTSSVFPARPGPMCFSEDRRYGYPLICDGHGVVAGPNLPRRME